MWVRTSSNDLTNIGGFDKVYITPERTTLRAIMYLSNGNVITEDLYEGTVEQVIEARIILNKVMCDEKFYCDLHAIGIERDLYDKYKE